MRETVMVKNLTPIGSIARTIVGCVRLELNDVRDSAMYTRLTIPWEIFD